MTKGISTPREQVSLEPFLANAYETFETHALSISARIVLWGSVQSRNDLRDRYLKAKGKSKLGDSRRHLTLDEEAEFLEIDSAAMDAWEYLQRVRQNNGQEISRECLVTYWSAFENCLKSIAVAFWLANKYGAPNLGAQIFVPRDDLKNVRKLIKKEWIAMDDFPKGKLFYEKNILEVNPYPEKYSFACIENDLWTRIGQGYDVRNSIVHSMAMTGSEYLTFDGETYSPGTEIMVSAASLRSLSKDMKLVLSPFRTYITMDDL